MVSYQQEPVKSSQSVAMSEDQRQERLNSLLTGRLAEQSHFPRDFTIIKSLGVGSFGTVYVADWHSALPSGAIVPAMQHSQTRPEYVNKRLVAIKKMKKPFIHWEDCIQLNELRSLLVMPPHEHIIPLYDVFLSSNSHELHMVFECMEGNLYQLVRARKGRPLAQGLVASISKQILEGLHHIHSNNFFHRDMKPENLLITTTGLGDYYDQSTDQSFPSVQQDVLVIVKIADFGLAREITSAPPYTEYVSTRWYRAPEVLFHAPHYTPAVDCWALGTILAEMLRLDPLFPGSSEMDQVLRICSVLGTPMRASAHNTFGAVPRGGGYWPEINKLCRPLGFCFPDLDAEPFAPFFPSNTPLNFIKMMLSMLQYNPASRISPESCLRHAYFREDAPRYRLRSKLMPSLAPAPHRSSSTLSPFSASSPDRSSIKNQRYRPVSSPLKSGSAYPSPNAATSINKNPSLYSNASHLQIAGSSLTPPTLGSHVELREALELHDKAVGVSSARQQSDQRYGSTPAVSKVSNAMASPTPPLMSPSQNTSPVHCLSARSSPGSKNISSQSAEQLRASLASTSSSLPIGKDNDRGHDLQDESPSNVSSDPQAKTSSPSASGGLASWVLRKSANTQRQSKQEKLKKREAELLAMRERSRAVLLKRSELLASEYGDRINGYLD
ncbi:non-specific serine/threonine protein kinase [Malassezia yamatoensis]|uniref:Non-specific serine/threonine protein kinase n=1 Tax=Malassezia yamatoensis TaxID=253288 RepID=A0AAJ6CH98_9BASI|nr:non-specific serine/threonine protein kinase [Malassezia yamatoensis]